MSRVARARGVDIPATLPDVVPGEPPPSALLVDEAREERLRRILYLIGTGSDEKTVLRTVAKEFIVSTAQVQADLGDIHDEIARRLDSEKDINALMFVALARAGTITQHFFEIATEPIPERVVEVPAAHPGEEAVYRPLTPGEKATLVQSKATAAKVVLASQDFAAKLAGKRSVRWAEKPANVVHVTYNQGGLSDEDREMLKRLEGG